MDKGEEAGVLRRLVAAAEAWSRQRGQGPVQAEGDSGLECCADGSVRTTVELQPMRPGAVRIHVRCLVTLEPDGTLACVALDQI
ncbi:MAG: hypothetical protein NVS2B7_37490 [Herpetosiphon sp.]